MKRPAVFLSRDDTLLEGDARPGTPESPRLRKGAASAVASMRGLGYRVIVVTNEPSVAAGKADERAIDAVHLRINELLGRMTGASVDRFYFCPYAPDAAHPDYARDHPWRKPRPGMLHAAAEDLELDLGRSWVIGATLEDVATGEAADLRTILISPPHVTSPPPPPDEGQPTPDFLASDLIEAVKILAQQRKPDAEAASGRVRRFNPVPLASVRQPRAIDFDPEARRDPQPPDASHNASQGASPSTRPGPSDQTPTAPTNAPTRSQPAPEGPPSATPPAAPPIEAPTTPEPEAPPTTAEAPTTPPGISPEAPHPPVTGMTTDTPETPPAAPAPPAPPAAPGPDAEPQDVPPPDPAAPDHAVPSEPAPATPAAPTAPAGISEPPPTPGLPTTRSASDVSPAPATPEAPASRIAASAEAGRTRAGEDDANDPSMQAAQLRLLRQILQELRATRGGQRDFGFVELLAVLCLVGGLVCLFGAFWMGDAQPELFIRWLGAGLTVQLAAIILLLMGRR